MTARLTLSTLGFVTLRRSLPLSEDEILPLVGKQLALVVYVACSPARSVHRETLVELLWPRLARTNGRVALRDMLRHLRQKLGEECFGPPGGDPVALAVPVECDRDRLIAAWEAADYARVVELYRGQFLPGLDGLDAAAFAHWVDGQREHLRRLFVQAALEVVQQHLLAWRPRQAVQVARRLVEQDEMDEAAWRAMLRCLIAMDDPVAAAVEVERLQRLIAEGDLDPDETTLRMIAEARHLGGGSSREPDAIVDSSLVADLVGREAEFSAILSEWQQARRGSLRCITLRGPAGSGKTRLLADVRARLHSLRAREDRPRTAQARASYGARDFPLAFAAELARGLVERRGAATDERGAIPIGDWAASALIALDPSLSGAFPSVAAETATGDELRRRISLALAELLKVLALQSPLAVFLDDLHWSHPESLRLIRAALGRCERLPLLVISASRASSEALCPAPCSDTIELDPLDVESVSALLSSLASLPEDDWAARFPAALTDATGGSPLLVLETLHLLIEDGALVRESNQWSLVDPDRLSRALAHGSAVRRRVDNLSSRERALLLVLAVAGVALDEAAIAAAVGGPHADVAPLLAGLEQRGLVALRGGQWSPGHDEHAAAVLEGAPMASQRAAAGAVGRSLALSANGEIAKVRRAAPLLARAGSTEFRLLADVFEHFVRQERFAGETRSDSALARELLAGEQSDTTVRALVRSLPWLVRARLVSGRRIAIAVGMAAFFLLTAAALVVSALQPEETPDAILLAEVTSEDGMLSVYDVPLHETHVPPGGVIDVDVTRRPRLRAPVPAFYELGVRPDARGWTMNMPVGDSGVIDIFDIGLDGRRRRLTYASGDDQGPNWSPDNAALAFTTGRWHFGQYDVAILDVATGTIRQLTSGKDADGSPSWSPDGSRIAFTRAYWTGGIGLCVIDTDGDGLRCMRSRYGRFGAPRGWSDSRHVVAGVDSGTVHRLVLVDVDDGMESLVEANAHDAVLSPDGQWVLCKCNRPGYPDGTWIVYRLGRPGEARRLNSIGVDIRNVIFLWGNKTPRAPYLDAVRIETGPGAPVAGVAYQLRATGYDSAGRATDVMRVRWSSGDTTVATIDPTGVLRPLRTGRVRIEASVGGWRGHAEDFTVVRPVGEVTLDETWNEGLATRWTAFGDPGPRVIDSKVFGPAFTNGGDASFFSGAYSARAFDTRQGLWLEAVESVPQKPAEWQDQIVSLRDMTSPGYARWDHRSGGFPELGPGCDVRYPGEEAIAFLGDSISTRSRNYVVPSGTRAGQPFRVLVQIFPDGRCGFALDGNPLEITAPRFFASEARVWLPGRTTDAEVVVGHLRVGSGIAPHIDWSALDPSRSRSSTAGEAGSKR